MAPGPQSACHLAVRRELSFPSVSDPVQPLTSVVTTLLLFLRGVHGHCAKCFLFADLVLMTQQEPFSASFKDGAGLGWTLREASGLPEGAEGSGAVPVLHVSLTAAIHAQDRLL